MAQRIRLLIFTLASALCLLIPGLASAFGISPDQIKVDNIYMGDTFNAIIHVSRANPDGACQYEVTVDTDSPYITTGMNFVEFAPGEISKYIPVLIHTKSLKAGNYSGMVYIKEIGKGDDFLSQLTRVQVPVNFSVTDEIIRDTSVLQYVLVTPNTERLLFEIHIHNGGNRTETFGAVELSVLDESGAPVVMDTSTLRFPFTQSIAPTDTITLRGDAKVSLKEQTYTVVSRAYTKDGMRIMDRKDSISPTTFRGPANVHEKTWISKSYTGILIISIICAILFLLVKLKNQFLV